jgi:protein-L-isoaspartate(D-aspartate) O-methyltransferase
MRTALARLRMVARLWRERRLSGIRHAWAFARVPRHRFVPVELEGQAYGPAPIELFDGQTITCPEFVAQMSGALQVRTGSRVLEVGTGTGYQAAILHALGARVTTFEIRPAIHALACRNLAGRIGTTLQVRLGDGATQFDRTTPFDGIVLGCATEQVPPTLLEQLAEGGQLVYPEGAEDRIQTLVVLRRWRGGIERRELRAAWFVPLVHAADLPAAPPTASAAAHQQPSA